MNSRIPQVLNVFLHLTESPQLVGRLAYKDHQLFFEYDMAFVAAGIEISPFKLPLKPGLQHGDPRLFAGLPGVFNDSLPDGWGRLLLDRALQAQGISPTDITILDRLRYVGERGMGALSYQPAYEENIPHILNLDLDNLASHAQTVLQGDTDSIINELLALNGSSAGARPKAMIGLHPTKRQIIYGTDALLEDYEHWLVKFPNSMESADSGAIEYTYSKLATLAGVEMMPTSLLSSKKGAGYFATKRFDRLHNKRLHIHSACGLLHSDFRAPCLDYRDLLKATFLLTKNQHEVEKLFRLAVFNVLAHNRDDHSKNFSFILNAEGEWRLAPAYDLTFSAGPGGEQSMLVMGEGRNITEEKLIELGKSASFPLLTIKRIIDEVNQALLNWITLARDAGVEQDNIYSINKILKVQI